MIRGRTQGSGEGPYGKAGIFQTRGLTADGLARALTDPALAQKLKADKILNLLPLAEAVVVYKAGTRT